MVVDTGIFRGMTGRRGKIHNPTIRVLPTPVSPAGEDCRFFVAALLRMTMALRRPHKGMKTGWRRERATTRVEAYDGSCTEPIFIAMSHWERLVHRHHGTMKVFIDNLSVDSRVLVQGRETGFLHPVSGYGAGSTPE